MNYKYFKKLNFKEDAEELIGGSAHLCGGSAHLGGNSPLVTFTSDCVVIQP